MKVLTLIGDGRRGKSTTIKLLYSLLLIEGFEQVSGSFWHFGKTNRGDLRGILTWKGILIGINSRGDEEELVVEDLNKFKNDGCQIVICAMRSKMVASVEKQFESMGVLQKNAAKGIRKDVEFDNSRMYAECHLKNAKDARELLEMLLVELK